MIKLGKASLRGEIIRPVCKCKLLRNFLPSPPFRARYFWQIFRECECGEVSANVREDRKIFIHVCENLKLRVTRVTRRRRDQIRKRKEVIGQMVQHGPTQRYRREKQAKRAQPSRMADITNVIIHPTLRPPRVWETKSVGQWILTKSCLTENYSGLPSLPHAIYFFHIRLRIIYIISNRSIPMIISYLSSNGFPLTREAPPKRASTFRIIMGIFLLTRLQFLLRPYVARESREKEWKIARAREWRKGTKVWIVYARVYQEKHTRNENENM